MTRQVSGLGLPALSCCLVDLPPIICSSPQEPGLSLHCCLPLCAHSWPSACPFTAVCPCALTVGPAPVRWQRYGAHGGKGGEGAHHVHKDRQCKCEIPPHPRIFWLHQCSPGTPRGCLVHSPVRQIPPCMRRAQSRGLPCKRKLGSMVVAHFACLSCLCLLLSSYLPLRHSSPLCLTLPHSSPLFPPLPHSSSP